MTKQTKQIVLCASIIGAAVASVTTAVVLLANKHRKKLALLKSEAEDAALFEDSCACEDALPEEAAECEDEAAITDT